MVPFGSKAPLTINHSCDTLWQLIVVYRYARAFGQYLGDMEWLTLTLEDHFNGMLGEAAVKVTGLGETAPYSGRVTFVQAGHPAITTPLLPFIQAAFSGNCKIPAFWFG